MALSGVTRSVWRATFLLWPATSVLLRATCSSCAQHASSRAPLGICARQRGSCDGGFKDLSSLTRSVWRATGFEDRSAGNVSKVTPCVCQGRRVLFSRAQELVARKREHVACNKTAVGGVWEPHRSRVARTAPWKHRGRGPRSGPSREHPIVPEEHLDGARPAIERVIVRPHDVGVVVRHSGREERLRQTMDDVVVDVVVAGREP